MYAPAQHDEITTTVRYLEQQLEAIRASVYGLTEEQAHATPCRSALSIGALIQHVIYGMRGATSRIIDGPRTGEVTEQEYVDFSSSTRLEAEQSVADLLPVFDAARTAYLAANAGLDPDGETLEPSAPWAGILEPTPIRWRYFLGHQMEELSRHAGHADIIREQIDGVIVPTLVNTLAGVPANPFFEPFVAQPGTITG